MLNFVGKYFLFGDTHSNIEYIVFFLSCIFVYLVGNIFAIEVSSTAKFSKITPFALLSLLLFLFLMWFFNGDSTWWSEPIGNWMNQIT